MKKSHFIAALAAPLAIVAIAGDAQAVDNKFFSGLTCYRDPSMPTGPAISRWFGTVTNPSSTSGAYILCPLVRDESSIGSASVQVFDRGGGSGDGGILSCALFYEFASGAGVLWGGSADDDSSGPAANFQTLTFPAMTGGNYYYATCFLPKATSLGWSHLIRWQITENG